MKDNAARFLQTLGGTMQNALSLTNVIGETQAKRGEQMALKGAEFKDVQGHSKAFIDGYVSVKAKKDVLDFQEDFSKRLSSAGTVEEKLAIVGEYEGAIEERRSEGLFGNTMYAKYFSEATNEMLSKARTSVANLASQETLNVMTDNLGLVIKGKLRSLASSGDIDINKVSTELDADYKQLTGLVGRDKAAEMTVSSLVSSVLNADPSELRGLGYRDTLKLMADMNIGGAKLSELSLGTSNTWNNILLQANNMDKAVTASRLKAAKDASDTKTSALLGAVGLGKLSREQALTAALEAGLTVEDMKDVLSVLEQRESALRSDIATNRGIRTEQERLETKQADEAILKELYGNTMSLNDFIRSNSDIWYRTSQSVRNEVFKEAERRAQLSPEEKRQYDEISVVIKDIMPQLENMDIHREYKTYAKAADSTRAALTAIQGAPETFDFKEEKRKQREEYLVSLVQANEAAAYSYRFVTQEVDNYVRDAVVQARQGNLLFSDGSTKPLSNPEELRRHIVAEADKVKVNAVGSAKLGDSLREISARANTFAGQQATGGVMSQNEVQKALLDAFSRHGINATE